MKPLATTGIAFGLLATALIFSAVGGGRSPQHGEEEVMKTPNQTDFAENTPGNKRTEVATFALG